MLSADENYAFISDKSERIRIVDINDTFHPSLFGEITPQEENTNLWAMDANHLLHTLFVAVGDKGVEFYDIENLEKIRFQERYSSDGETRGLALSADHTLLYLANGEKGIEILDLSQPDTPRPFARFEY